MTGLTESQSLFIEAYSEHGNISLACKTIDIHRSTHYEWLKSDKSDTYKKAFEEATEGLHDKVEDALMGQINKGNVTAIIFFCKTKMRHRGYVEPEKEEQSQSDIVDHERFRRALSMLSDAAYNEFRESYAKAGTKET